MNELENVKLVFEPIWSWWAVVPTCLLLVAFVLTTYPPRVRHLRPLWRRTLIGARLAAALVLCFAMLRPELHFQDEEEKTATLLILVDASRSTNTADGPSGTTRRAAMLKAIADSESSLARLKERVDLQYYDFDRELRAVDELQPAAQGQQTALGAVLEALLSQSRGSRTAGALMLSDGAQRALPPHDADPRAVARRLGELQVPVYTVPFGSSSITGTALDLAAEDLLVDPVAFEKKTVPVSARIRVVGAANRELTVRLLLEDRGGRSPGQAGEMTIPPANRNAVPTMRIRPTGNSDVIPVNLSFVPDRPGEFKLALEVVPLDEELVVRNNRLETLITVRKGGINIAYFDIVRPEAKFIGKVNRTDQIQLDYIPVKERRFQHQTEISPQLFERDAYDAYIIGDVPASVFGADLLRRLFNRVEDGAGLMMTGGLHSYSAGGYAQSPLADLLPVALDPGGVQAPDVIDETQQHLQDLQMQPTRAGQSHYVMLLDSPDRNREAWAELAPLNGANRLRKKHDLIQVLAESPDGIPLLFSHERGQARILSFAGDTTWLWHLQGHEEYHQRFWRQIILWLSRKELDGDQPVWARVEPRNVNPASPAAIEFGARDENGAPIEGAEFQVEVTLPDGEKVQVPPQTLGERNLADFTRTELPGDYWVRVSATRDGESLGLDAFTRFIVDARDLEMDNPAADPALLEEIARLTGGTSVPPETLTSFLDELSQQPLLEDSAQLQRTTLWDNWYLLLLFVSLMSAEWFVRKSRGLV